MRIYVETQGPRAEVRAIPRVRVAASVTKGSERIARQYGEPKGVGQLTQTVGKATHREKQGEVVSAGGEGDGTG